LRRWYFLCVSDAITHDLLSPCPGRPFCTSEKSRIQRRSVTAYTLKARLADAQATQLHLADAIVEQAVC
ncbi:hypothetical protein, partial [Acidithiobacillus sp.]